MHAPSSGGLNHLFWWIIFSFLGHGKQFLKNCISFSRNDCQWIECNVLFNNKHLILIWFFLLIDTEFYLKITLRLLNPENQQLYLWKSAKCCYFQNQFQYPYRFQNKLKIISVMELKKDHINFLFIAVIYFPLSI